MTETWNASKIKVVMFDHGGVLTRGGEKGTNEKAATAAMGLNELIEIPELNTALKIGEITNAEWVDGINDLYPHAPRPLTMQVWDDIYRLLEPDWNAYTLPPICRRNGYRTGILSSISPDMATRLYKDGSYDGFDPVVLSCKVGLAKPDPRIYRLVEKCLYEDGMKVRPDKILFLDDQEKCCAAARNEGWNAIRVDSTQQLVADVMRTLGLL